MDPSGTNGTVIFDRDDHPRGGNIILIEHDGGNVTIFAHDTSRTFTRLGLLLECIEWACNGVLKDEYDKAVDKFLRGYYTESEWTLAALSMP